MTDAPRLTADDRLEIIDLLARYAYAMDGTDPQAFLDCFIPDAELDIGYRTVKGAAELRREFPPTISPPSRAGHGITTSPRYRSKATASAAARGAT